MACNNKENEFERNIETLGSRKNFGAIVSGMKSHAMHAGVQEKACRAFNDRSFASADNQVLIAEAGGIPLILAALDKHAEHAAVVEQACGALCNIGWSDKVLQKSIKAAGAVKLLRAAVGRSDATADTKELGQQLLNRLGRL